MPLDTTQKVNHVSAVIARAFAGRTRNVVFVYLSGGVYSYTLQTVIWRPQIIVEPTEDQVPHAMQQAEVIMRCFLTVSFTGVVYIADTTIATSGAVAAAQKYEVIEVVPVGIIPGGTHYNVLLRRLR
jgi:hypothetical protein